MSHAVTITRTTTTTSSSAIILYTGYLKTLPGILKLLQTVVNIACVGILGYYFDNYNFRWKQEQFFLLVAVTFLINTALLFITSLLSFGTASILPKTVYEYWYHATAFFLYLSAGLSLIIEVSRYGKRHYFYEELMAASVLGLINAGLYLFAAILSYRSCRLG